MPSAMVMMAPTGRTDTVSWVVSIAFFLFIIFLLRAFTDQTPTIISHWYHLVEAMKQSSQDFYERLEAAIAKRNIPGIKLSPVSHLEGGVFSAQRMYLRAKRKEHSFDVCAAPFGNGFFVSWWLGVTISRFWYAVLMVPLLGPYLVRLFHPDTYYRIDTALMFQESIRSAVLEVLDETTQAQGLRSLSESERKPILRELFKRR